jgi:uncharacterized protein (TIGR00730 family)
MIKNIAIFGGAEAKVESELYKQTYQTAKLLAENGFTIVNGGGPGVMLASTEGAESVDGKTLSVTFNPKDAPGFEGRYVKNRTDKEIKTHNYIERMFTLMEHADAFVITNGGTGTISEFGTAWCLARLYYGHHKPFVLLGEFWHNVMDTFKKNMMMRPNDHDVYKFAHLPQEVLKCIEEFNQEIKEKHYNKS